MNWSEVKVLYSDGQSATESAYLSWFEKNKKTVLILALASIIYFYSVNRSKNSEQMENWRREDFMWNIKSASIQYLQYDYLRDFKTLLTSDSANLFLVSIFTFFIVCKL